MKIYKLFLNLALIAISLGWMIGLSKSPTISSVISTILTFIISILIILSGIEPKDEKITSKLYNLKISLMPISVFCFFLALSATFGAYVRAHNYLGIEIENIETNSSKNSNKTKINNSEKPSAPKQETGLYGISPEQCSEISLRQHNYKNLKIYLEQLDKDHINEFLKFNPDSSSLVKFSEGICSEN